MRRLTLTVLSALTAAAAIPATSNVIDAIGSQTETHATIHCYYTFNYNYTAGAIRCINHHRSYRSRVVCFKGAGSTYREVVAYGPSVWSGRSWGYCPASYLAARIGLSWT